MASHRGVPPPTFHPPSYWVPTIYYNSPVSMNPAGDGTILIGYAGGWVYSFDPDKQATTLLEQLTLATTSASGDSGALYFVGGFVNNRIASYDAVAGDLGSGNVSASGVDNTVLATWQSDTVTAGGSSVAVTESSIWDFDLPEQIKTLDGFSVVCDIPETEETVTIEYQIDQDGTWTLAGTVLPSATSLYHYFPVSNSTNGGITCSTVQFRTSILGSPRVFSVTAHARVADFEETWTMDVLLRDEVPGTRISSRQDPADALRDFLWTSYRTKEVLAFEDAYISDSTGPNATPTGGLETYSVTIDSIEDIIDTAGQGKCRLVLRRVVDVAS